MSVDRIVGSTIYVDPESGLYLKVNEISEISHYQDWARMGTALPVETCRRLETDGGQPVKYTSPDLKTAAVLTILGEVPIIKVEK